jgi:DNA polymerase (family 10)
MCTVGKTLDVENAAIAERLEAYAALLDLAGSGYYTVRAYRRAAELIRSTPADVAALARRGRAKELAGIGPGIDAKLRELVQTGEIAELRELERQALPELVGVAPLLGLSTKRMRELGHGLGIATLAELREASAAGRLEAVPGIANCRRAGGPLDGTPEARHAPEPGAGTRRRDGGGAGR